MPVDPLLLELSGATADDEENPDFDTFYPDALATKDSGLAELNDLEPTTDKLHSEQPDISRYFEQGTSLSALTEYEQFFDLEPAFTQPVDSPQSDCTESSSSALVNRDKCTLPSTEFIDYFARVNVRSESTQPVTGGSRDESTIFQHSCPKKCGYTTPTRSIMQRHAMTCDGKPKGKLAQQPHIPCRIQCGKVYMAKKTESSHYNKVHAWKPKPCSSATCDQSVLYPDHKSFARHKAETHNWKARTCPLCLPGTKNDTKMWATKEQFKSHLICFHSVSKAEMDDILMGGTEED
jgi:uncharacterized C2H2 Zn-finger protein